MPPTDISFDLGTAVERLRVSIRRASVFIGISSNIRAAVPPISHVLDSTHRVRVQMVPQDVSPEVLGHFHEEFDHWVIGNGLRDIIDSFSLYVTALYVWFLFIIDPSARPGINRIERRFAKKGLREQVTDLCEKAGIVNEYADTFEAWRRARNCLSHRNGVVSVEDCDPATGDLTICWQSFVIYANYGTCRQEIIDLDIQDEFRATEDTQISVVYESITRSFALGSHLRLSRRQLLEICLCAFALCDRLHDQYVAALEARGIIIRRPSAATGEID